MSANRVEKQQMVKINPTSRNLKSVNDEYFALDEVEKLSQLNTMDILQTLCEGYLKAIISTLDKHVPEIIRKRAKRQPKS